MTDVITGGAVEGEALGLQIQNLANNSPYATGLTGLDTAQRIRTLAEHNPYATGLTGADMGLRIRTLAANAGIYGADDPRHNSGQAAGLAGLMTPTNIALGIAALIIIKKVL